ncbi:hypothetical protein ERO13_D01G157850v2 [Gossypium hirsutum]|nr:hypothetical protein ERO13_D01G157850v2 [Gossypium hirsutum]
MDFIKRVNRFFNLEREVIQNPLAPEPAEVPHTDPQQEQCEALRSAIHTLILEQVREHSSSAPITNPQGILRILVIHSFQPSILFSRPCVISPDLDFSYINVTSVSHS